MEDASRVRRKDTTKGPPLRILSLDGGGVRGYSIFIILQELMHRTFVEMEGRAPKRHEIPKPCDHFDLIAGTGTGGLIAIMLGRLRLDLDTCKETYVRMTRRVFETDKTLMGIPLRGTMFKASKLEEAIMDCVREHTIFDDEGNDALANAVPMTPGTPTGIRPQSGEYPQRSMSQSSRYSQIGVGPTNTRASLSSLRFGDRNALLYDTRENRTKTAVTAVLRGTPVITLLRSYDSRREPAPDVNCTIWQAGRATCATQMAFKPLQIGQSVYLDDGAGKYNPAPQILDEAVQNEWPGREVGVFISIGTGKRPPHVHQNQHEWWEGFLGSGMGDFAEARRRLMSKIEGCEATHQYMLREYLAARGVPVDNYFRLNVEVGVGEMGMNEWHRLAEISTNTRMYLSKNEVQSRNCAAAAKIAKIHLAKLRHDRAEARAHHTADSNNLNPNPWERPLNTVPPVPSSFAAELPGDESFAPYDRHSAIVKPLRPHSSSLGDQKYTVIAEDEYDASPQSKQPTPTENNFSYNSPSSPRPSHDASFRPPAPPVPPKTPVSGLPYPDAVAPGSGSPGGGNGFSGARTFMNMGELGRRLPYPDVEGPPPPVNTANKPQMLR